MKKHALKRLCIGNLTSTECSYLNWLKACFQCKLMKYCFLFQRQEWHQVLKEWLSSLAWGMTSCYLVLTPPLLLKNRQIMYQLWPLFNFIDDACMCRELIFYSVWCLGVRWVFAYRKISWQDQFHWGCHHYERLNINMTYKSGIIKRTSHVLTDILLKVTLTWVI